MTLDNWVGDLALLVFLLWCLWMMIRDILRKTREHARKLEEDWTNALDWFQFREMEEAKERKEREKLLLEIRRIQDLQTAGKLTQCFGCGALAPQMWEPEGNWESGHYRYYEHGGRHFVRASITCGPVRPVSYPLTLEEIESSVRIERRLQA